MHDIKDWRDGVEEWWEGVVMETTSEKWKTQGEGDVARFWGGEQNDVATVRMCEIESERQKSEMETREKDSEKGQWDGKTTTMPMPGDDRKAPGDHW